MARLGQLCERRLLKSSLWETEPVDCPPGSPPFINAVVALVPRDAETPESLLIRDTLAPELQAAIDALPDAFRQAVWLRDVEEFSYAEIARMLDIPIGTVMSRISRGRHLLYEHLQHLRPVNA